MTDRCHGQKEKDEATKHYLQTTQTTTDWAPRTPLKTGGELSCPEG